MGKKNSAAWSRPAFERRRTRPDGVQVGAASPGRPKRLPRPAAGTSRDSTLLRNLLGWFRRNARDLPWRRTRDPYAIWVSEIMLQQTQVSTVLPYWERWMRSLPNIEALAAVDQQTLHKLWEGLGYYARARNLQQAAQMIIVQHGGQFPRDFEAVLALPGIGPYTAGAICSIAFNQPRPAVDGNVIRILARLFGIRGNARSRAVSSRLWQIAAKLLRQAADCPGSRSGREFADLNEALMELGALVCLPRQPRCERCPVVKNCTAHRDNIVMELPNLGARPRTTFRRWVALVARRGDCFLVQQRPPGTVNAYLWEFPNAELTTSGAVAVRTAADLLDVRRTPRLLCRIAHSITRYRITLEVFEAELPRHGQRSHGAGKWLTLEELERLPFASAHRKVLTYLRSRSGPLPVSMG